MKNCTCSPKSAKRRKGMHDWGCPVKFGPLRVTINGTVAR